LSAAQQPAPDASPPLVAGAQLDRATFHRRCEAMPPGTRAELIGGVVHMPSPVGRAHARAAADVITWLNLYRRRTPGVEVLDHATIALDDAGEPQPDALLRILPRCGGQTRDEVFPGLWLDPVALLAGDLDGLIATLERGLASPEHAAFVARLAVTRDRP
jgi:hypothetical protein